MRFKMYDPDERGHTLGEIDGDQLPRIGEIFVVDGYPLRCTAHIPVKEENRPFAGVVVGEPPEEMVRSLLKPGTEELAKTNYAFSVSIAPTAHPTWENASPLQRRKFRLDAEGFREDLRRRGD
jgi:hypothetical protein